MRVFVVLGALAAAALPASAAQAQDSGDGTWRIRPGIGAQIRPEYPGADEKEWAPYFTFDLAKGTDEFRFSGPDDPFGIGLLSAGPFRVGPSLAIQSGRKDSDVGAPLGKVKTTIEAGGFAEVMLMDQFRLRGDLRKGIGGHEGLVGSLAADQIWRDGDRYVFSIGPRLLYSDDRYQRAFFGVSPDAAVLTGLAAYEPDGGFHAVAAAAGLQYALGGPLGLFGYARYERLIGDAGRSPVVREFGSRSQTSAGLGISYTFALQPSRGAPPPR